MVVPCFHASRQPALKRDLNFKLFHMPTSLLRMTRNMHLVLRSLSRSKCCHATVSYWIIYFNTFIHGTEAANDVDLLAEIHENTDDYRQTS